MWRRAWLAGMLFMALLGGAGAAMATPLPEDAASFETLASSVCAPNPAPAPRGQRTVNVSTPSSG